MSLNFYAKDEKHLVASEVTNFYGACVKQSISDKPDSFLSRLSSWNEEK